MSEREKKYNYHDPLDEILRRHKKDAVLIVAGIIMGIFFEWTMVEVAIFIVFLWSILGPIPSRFLAFATLFFLAFTPLLLVFERKAQAEEFAIYAYYFLVMAVIRGIIEIRQEDVKEKPLVENAHN